MARDGLRIGGSILMVVCAVSMMSCEDLHTHGPGRPGLQAVAEGPPDQLKAYYDALEGRLGKLFECVATTDEKTYFDCTDLKNKGLPATRLGLLVYLPATEAAEALSGALNGDVALQDVRKAPESATTCPCQYNPLCRAKVSSCCVVRNTCNACPG